MGAIRAFIGLNFLLAKGNCFVPEGYLVGQGSATRFDFGDDSATNVPISGSYKFLGTSYSEIFANGNGVITLGTAQGYYRFNCNKNSTSTPTIAVYMIDSQQSDDTENAKLLHQELISSRSPSSFVNVAQDVLVAFPDFRGRLEKMVVVTWKDIPLRGTKELNPLRDTFQAVLASQGENTFLLFYYSRIEWPSRVSGAPPSEAGIYGGSRNLRNTYIIPGSCNYSLVNIAGMSNIGQPGKFVFKVDHKIEKPKVVSKCIPDVSAPRSVDFKPRVVSALGGSQVLVSGLDICLDHNVTKLWCKFHEYTKSSPTSLEGTLVPVNLGIVCPTPKQFTRVGMVRVTLEINFTDNRTFTTEGFVIVTKQEQSKSVVYRESPGHFTAIWNNTLFQNQPLNELYMKLLGRQPSTANVVISFMELRNSTWNEFYRVTNVATSGQASIAFPENLTMALTSPGTKNTLQSYIVSDEFGEDYGSFQTKFVHDVIDTTIAFASWKPSNLHQRQCMDWYSKERSLIHDGPACPTTLYEALYDWRYTHEAWGTTANNFLQNAQGPAGSGTKCSYDHIGKLVATIQYDSHPSFNYLKHNLNDILPEITCCTLASSVSKTCVNYFMEKRKVTSGTYKYPVPFKVNGATHISTLDGANFMLNAAGAFWLLKSPHTSVQVLSERYSDAVNSSVITAAVMTGEQHSRLQVVSVQTGLQIWINEHPVNFYRSGVPNEYEYMAENFVIYGDIVTIFVNSTESALFSFSNGLSIKFIKTMGSKGLHIIGSLTYEFKGNVAGLIGNYDGDAANDLDFNSKNDMKISELAKYAEKWRVSRHDLYFWFPEPKDYVQIAGNFRSIQKTEQDILSSGHGISICGNITECSVDFILTQNADLVKSSLRVYFEYVEMAKYVKSTEPISQETSNVPKQQGNDHMRVILICIWALYGFI